MSRQVRIGKIKIGGDNPVAIQSMANIKTSRFNHFRLQYNQGVCER